MNTKSCTIRSNNNFHTMDNNSKFISHCRRIGSKITRRALRSALSESQARNHAIYPKGAIPPYAQLESDALLALGLRAEHRWEVMKRMGIPSAFEGIEGPQAPVFRGVRGRRAVTPQMSHPI